MWPIAGLLSWFYVLFLPCTPCIPALKELCDTLLKWIQYCEKVGQNIKEGKSLSAK
jgi:hypothetical protein